jgi:hypothetical protein
VFYGGDVDIVYCSLEPDDGGEGAIDEIRVDVARGADVDIAEYLDEEFTDGEVEPTDAGAIGGGTLSTACWDDGDMCGAFWQGDGLFVATVISGEEQQSATDAATISETLVPMVIERLAARAT